MHIHVCVCMYVVWPTWAGSRGGKEECVECGAGRLALYSTNLNAASVVEFPVAMSLIRE